MPGADSAPPAARRPLRPARLLLLLLLWVAATEAAASVLAHLPEPAADDQSAASLRARQEMLLSHYGGDPRQVPLEVKAEHFEWMLWRYHFAPHRQVMPRVTVPERPGEPVEFLPGADVSTWNGALLAGLSYKWAVTRDPRTLARIADLLEGMHLYFEVTGVPGLPARCVMRRDQPVGRVAHEWVAPDGTRYFYRGEPAKGTANQLVLGYATLLRLAASDLPPAARQRAEEDLGALVGHLVQNGYRLTRHDGRTTRYGNLSPFLFWRVGTPFNAQVSYAMVAAAHRFPSADPTRRDAVAREFARLRRSEPWSRAGWKPPFYDPQRVGRSRFIGTNDKNHLANAAFLGLALELDAARHEAREPDARFLRRFGRTLYWSMKGLEGNKNSLCNFMWAGLLRDPRLRQAVVPDSWEATRRQVESLLETGVEQLRRFPLDRFRWQGVQEQGREAQWVDRYRPDSYHWKVKPRLVWQVTGPPTNLLTSAIDYLHAYWLFRHYELDQDPVVRARHGDVLGAPGDPAAPAQP